MIVIGMDIGYSNLKVVYGDKSGDPVLVNRPAGAAAVHGARVGNRKSPRRRYRAPADPAECRTPSTATTIPTSSASSRNAAARHAVSAGSPDHRTTAPMPEAESSGSSAPPGNT